MKTYTFTVEDDRIADDFEAGAARIGLTPEALFAKDVSDLANFQRREVADEAKPEIDAATPETSVKEFAEQLAKPQ